MIETERARRTPDPMPEGKVAHPEESSELRARGIGSSDAPKIANLVKWRTPYQLYMEKIGVIDPEEAGEEAYWGSKLEPMVLSHYAEITGYNVIGKSDLGHPIYTHHSPDGTSSIVQCGYNTFDDAMALVREVWHGEIDHMLAHLDGVACDDKGEIHRIVEAKTAGIWVADHFGREGTDEIPKAYIVQCQHIAEVCRSVGLDVPVDVPTLIAGQNHKLFTVERNERLVKIIVSMNAEFWLRVQELNPPDIDGSEFTKDILRQLYPEDDGTTIRVEPADVEYDLVQRYRKAQMQEKDAKYETEACRNMIKENMEKSSRWEGNSWSISYRLGKEKLVTDWEATIVEFRNALAFIEKDLGEDGLDVPAVTAMLNEALDNQTNMTLRKRNFSPSLTRLALPAPKEEP